MNHRGARGNHGNWKRKRPHSFSPRSHDFPPHLRESLEPCFDKVFMYNGMWPEVNINDVNGGGATKWQDNELQSVKVTLNGIKSQLNDYDINTWHEHTCAMNPAGLIINTVKRAAYPELCTQAWCKFHEILCKFDILRPAPDGTLKTLHLCEAPGAFVTSLNHYLQSRNTGVLDWQWTANTLNPHYEGNAKRNMIADDRFIQNTMDNWHFGGDNTGNIMSAANIRDVIGVSGSGSINLVTADGSICCANNPAEQESETAKLHFCEVVTALSALAKGGSFVLKMFTVFEESSISLMYLLNCAFEQVHMFKPCTSKPGNSEVYIVSLGFKSVSGDVLEKLLNEVNESPFQNCILKESAIPDSFRVQHRKCCQTFFDYQTATIQENRTIYLNPLQVKEKEELDLKRQCCAEMYIGKCKLRKISFQQRIVPKSNAPQNSANPYVTVDLGYLGKERVEGSYVERQNCSRIEKLRSLPKFDLDLGKSNLIGGLEIDHERFEDKYADSANWDLATGRKIECVHSSRFCNQHLLSLYSDCLEELSKLEGEEKLNIPTETHSGNIQGIAQLLADASLKSVQETEPLTSQDQHESQNAQNLIKMTVLCNHPDGNIAKRLKDCVVESESLKKHLETDDKLKDEHILPKVLCIEYEPSVFNNSENVQTKKTDKTLSQISVWQSEFEFLTNKDTQIELLNELQRLVDGDHVIVTLPIHVTRLTNSVLFILSHVFQTVKFVPSHFQSFPTVTVICLNFIQMNFERFSELITKVCASFERSNHQSTPFSAYLQNADEGVAKETIELLQFVPMKLMYTSAFYCVVSQVNDKLLQLRINALLSLLSQSNATK